MNLNIILSLHCRWKIITNKKHKMKLIIQISRGFTRLFLTRLLFTEILSSSVKSRILNNKKPWFSANVTSWFKCISIIVCDFIRLYFRFTVNIALSKMIHIVSGVIAYALHCLKNYGNVYRTYFYRHCLHYAINTMFETSLDLK